ncbi:MAG: glycoside hydrolase family 127 protein [Bacteroidales bacterium]|nr:glycoside hydrolase family 127 protein [Bacteroidales bacterium]
MKSIKSVVALLAILAIGGCTGSKSDDSASYQVSQVPFTDVKIAENSFWGDRLKAAREVTIPLAFSKCESEGRYRNFEMAVTPSPDNPPSGFPFDDTDVYKTIEGASYILQTYPDKKLESYIDSVLDIVAAAQEPDGYLYTPRTMNPWHPHAWSGSERWQEVEGGSHEFYNLGHMVDAACAHYQATGSTKFLDIAKRYADCVIREIGTGEGQKTVVPGHQIAEMALARLYVLTGEKKYLDQAKYFLDYRGKTVVKNQYSQSDIPVVDQREAWGHAVRAGYMYSGMADVAALTGDKEYVNAIDSIWDNIVTKKYYITGGVGARHSGEAFGADYELPNKTAYNETCAAIAQVYLNQRMFMLHGDSKYIDCLERTLYNGVICGMSVDGGKFFYPNPLSADSVYRFNSGRTMTRQPWFGCACCPSNLCRFIPSVPGYVYGVKGKDLYVNLFAENTAEVQMDGGSVTLSQKTDYPWNGDVTIKVEDNKTGKFTVKVRIPGWVRNQVVPGDLYEYADGLAPQWSIAVNGSTQKAKVGADGYVALSRNWKAGDVIAVHFDMPVRVVEANKNVEDDRGKIAVERGPLVYCAEWADNAGKDVHTTAVGGSSFEVVPNYGITNSEGDGKVFNVTEIKASKGLALIPYYAWNHRGAGNMEVWLAE